MPTHSTRIAATSIILETAARLAAIIERSGENVLARCNAITNGAGDLQAGIAIRIDANDWYFPSSSRPGQRTHTVRPILNGNRRLTCTCEAGAQDLPCRHVAARTIAERIMARPDAAQVCAWITAPEPQPYPGTDITSPAEAERRFWRRYGSKVGGTTWDAVTRFLGRELPKPTTIADWLAVAEEVRDTPIDPAVAAAREAARAKAQREVDELYPPQV
jgi:hypothetical protein